MKTKQYTPVVVEILIMQEYDVITFSKFDEDDDVTGDDIFN